MAPHRDTRNTINQNDVRRDNIQERRDSQIALSSGQITIRESPYENTPASTQALARIVSVRELGLPYRKMAPERSIIGHISPTKPQFDWKSYREDCFRFIFDKKKKTVCERNWKSWLYILIYSVMYLVFLTTCTMILLFAAFSIAKADGKYSHLREAKQDSNALARNGVRLSATPSAVRENSLISYRASEDNDHRNYSRTIDQLLRSRKKGLTNSLGPCGHYPYGYGEKPCVIVTVNAGSSWWAEPLSPNSTLTQFAPAKVRNWIQSGAKRLWLHCNGHNPVDQENLGEITYYPDPPGINPSLFPLNIDVEPPIVAVQFSNYAQGVKIIVQCKLWYESGPSTVFFMLYVEPGQ